MCYKVKDMAHNDMQNNLLNTVDIKLEPRNNDMPFQYYNRTDNNIASIETEVNDVKIEPKDGDENQTMITLAFSDIPNNNYDSNYIKIEEEIKLECFNFDDKDPLDITESIHIKQGTI